MVAGLIVLLVDARLLKSLLSALQFSNAAEVVLLACRLQARILWHCRPPPTTDQGVKQAKLLVGPSLGGYLLCLGVSLIEGVKFNTTFLSALQNTL